MTDKMREAFEKWAKAECFDLDSIDGFYSDNDTHIAWGAWQAAQSVPVVGEVWRWAINKADGAPLLLISSQADADKYRSMSGLEVFPVYRQPTHSISAAELERLRKDAERYRWLRDTNQSRNEKDEDLWSIAGAIDPVYVSCGNGSAAALESEEFDKAIDAAIAGEKK